MLKSPQGSWSFWPQLLFSCSLRRKAPRTPAPCRVRRIRNQDPEASDLPYSKFRGPEPPGRLGREGLRRLRWQLNLFIRPVSPLIWPLRNNAEASLEMTNEEGRGLPCLDSGE